MWSRTSGASGEQCGGILYFALNGLPVRRLMVATAQDGQSKKKSFKIIQGKVREFYLSQGKLTFLGKVGEN